MGALPTPKDSPLAREAQHIKDQIDRLAKKMQKETKGSPIGELEECAKQVIQFINRHHSEIASYESYLKAAIIDLTEVPQMAPQMQRIAYMTALKDASHEMQLFISCL